MSTLTRKQRVKMARRGRTREEIVKKVSIWDTEFWLKRKIAREDRVAKQQKRAA